MHTLKIQHVEGSDPPEFQITRPDGKSVDPVVVPSPVGFPVEGRRATGVTPTLLTFGVISAWPRAGSNASRAGSTGDPTFRSATQNESHQRSCDPVCSVKQSVCPQMNADLGY